MKTDSTRREEEFSGPMPGDAQGDDLESAN